MLDELHRRSLVEVAGLLRRRELGAVELTEAMLARITAHEPDVRAFVTVTADLAREQASAAQRILDRDGADATALTGIPLAVKDLIDVRGVPTTAGSRVLADNRAQRDSAVWSQLKRSGAVLVGKANTHEFAYGGATEPTRNPWDLDKMVGGSSGGSAAGLAAGMCFGALGTDTAGSIRIPAAFCGVSGLKPTRNSVSARGVIPLSQSLDCVGPMARTPMDTAELFAAMLPGRRAGELRAQLAGADVHGLRVAIWASGETVSDSVRDAVSTAAAALANSGAVVRALAHPGLDLAAVARVNFTIMAAESAHNHQRWLAECPEKYSDYVRERLLESARTPAVDYLEALAAAKRMRAELDAMLDGVDILLLSGMPCVAPTAYVSTVEVAGEVFDRDWLMCRDTAFANVTGHPVLAVPTGLADGLPVGVQLVAAHRRESVLFPAGQAIYDRLAAPIP